MHMKKALQLLIVLLVLFLAACGNTESSETEDEDSNTENENNTNDTTSYPNDVEENPIVTIETDAGDPITIELYPEVAPNTVANFISLIEEGYYDGLIFHRVIPGFMIQGGDPSGDGTGGPDYSIHGEFSSNGFENTLTHDSGVLSMARSQSPDSAGSQFFIMTEESSHLDGDYASFGKVVDGLETVDKIVSTERDSTDKPLEDQTMLKVEVDIKGYTYPEPEVMDK